MNDPHEPWLVDGRSMWLDRKSRPISPLDWERLKFDTRRWNGRPYFRVGNTPVSWLHPKGDHVSTVWLGIDMGMHPGSDPVIYETMVFGGPLDGEQARYTTAKQARVGHRVMVQLARAAVQVEADRDRTYTALSYWWSRRRRLWPGTFGVALCLWFVVMDLRAGRVAWALVFVGLLALNLIVMTVPYFITFHRIVRPHQEGRERFREDLEAGLIPGLSPDAARWHPDMLDDEEKP